jgi:hypothetical protein
MSFDGRNEITTAELQREVIVQALRTKTVPLYNEYCDARARYERFFMSDAHLDAAFNALADAGLFNRRHPEIAITADEVYFRSTALAISDLPNPFE